MPQLDYISVHGFKSIASIEKLPLKAINLLIGPNGSGKSNFIGVFSFLHAIREGHLEEYVIRNGGAEKLLHFGSKITSEIELMVSFKNETNQYYINLVPSTDDLLVPVKEVAFFWDKRYSSPLPKTLKPIGNEAGISSSSNRLIAGYVRDHLGSWRVYHFHDTSAACPMKKTADLNDNRFLRPDGSNLAAYLYYLRSKHENSYQLIRHSIQRVAPFFDDFVLEPQKLNPDKLRMEWRHQDSEAFFDASSLSDGTLRFMALATLFLQPQKYRPSVILVDEPELGLHPLAITLLASMIKQASLTTQVIVSTQSSLLLDHFQPEDILVANRVNGATEFKHLNSSELATWLDDYSLGQLWEKNYIGGRPGVA